MPICEVKRPLTLATFAGSMASWMTDWAEKGGSLLNSLDNHVASFLQPANSAIVPPPVIPRREQTPPRLVENVKPGVASPVTSYVPCFDSYFCHGLMIPALMCVSLLDTLDFHWLLRSMLDLL